MRKRLAFDAALEFGLNSRIGRTLELTGAVAVEVEAGRPRRMAAAARHGARRHRRSRPLTRPASPTTRRWCAWVRGVLDRMRAQGAIEHPWFEQLPPGGRQPLVDLGRPAPQRGHARLPATAAPAPGVPAGRRQRRADATSGLDPVDLGAESWYAQWTSRALGVSAADGGRLARLLLERLAARRRAHRHRPASPAPTSTRSRPPASSSPRPTTSDLAAGRHLLVCDTCQGTSPGTADRRRPARRRALPARPLPRPADAERRLADNFYRRLYASPDMRRVVAREHTSLLDDETRLAYENGFKGADDQPAGAERARRHADAGDGHRHRRPVHGVPGLAAPHRRRRTCSGSAAPAGSPATRSTSPSSPAAASSCPSSATRCR